MSPLKMSSQHELIATDNAESATGKYDFRMPLSYPNQEAEVETSESIVMHHVKRATA